MVRSAAFRPFLHAALCLVALPLVQAAPQAADAGARERLERHARLELVPIGFSGSVLVRRGDELLLRRGFGLADRARVQANTPETSVTLGGLTPGEHRFKAFGANAQGIGPESAEVVVAIAQANAA